MSRDHVRRGLRGHRRRADCDQVARRGQRAAGGRGGRRRPGQGAAEAPAARATTDRGLLDAARQPARISQGAAASRRTSSTRSSTTSFALAARTARPGCRAAREGRPSAARMKALFKLAAKGGPRPRRTWYTATLLVRATIESSTWRRSTAAWSASCALRDRRHQGTERPVPGTPGGIGYRVLQLTVYLTRHVCELQRQH